MASSSSAGTPDMILADDTSMSAISEEKPGITLVIAFYNITWDNSRFNNMDKHERTLTEDIKAALDTYNTDVLLLSECGAIGKGLYEDKWLPMLHRICGDGYEVTHQAHYTSIVKLDTLQITVAPSLQGPLSTHPGHECQVCQHFEK